MPLRLFAFASTFVPSTLAVPTRSSFGSFASGSTSGNAAATASRLLRRNVQIVSWSGWQFAATCRTPMSRHVARSIRREPKIPFAQQCTSSASIVRGWHCADPVPPFVHPDRLHRHLDMPLWGVFGNNDQEREALDAAIAKHGFTFQEPPLEVVWHSRRIVVVHDPLEFEALTLTRHTNISSYGREGHFLRWRRLGP